MAAASLPGVIVQLHPPSLRFWRVVCLCPSRRRCLRRLEPPRIHQCRRDEQQERRQGQGDHLHEFSGHGSFHLSDLAVSTVLAIRLRLLLQRLIRLQPLTRYTHDLFYVDGRAKDAPAPLPRRKRGNPPENVYGRRRRCLGKTTMMVPSRSGPSQGETA